MMKWPLLESATRSATPTPDSSFTKHKGFPAHGLRIPLTLGLSPVHCRGTVDYQCQ